jgi:hypothetical protein
MAFFDCLIFDEIGRTEMSLGIVTVIARYACEKAPIARRWAATIRCRPSGLEMKHISRAEIGHHHHVSGRICCASLRKPHASAPLLEGRGEPSMSNGHVAQLEP